MKANFEKVDTRAILDRLADIPIQTWNYKAQNDSIRHIGPMAQDFRAAFGVGEDERHITNVDADGVALAAIQALNQMTQDKDDQIQLQQTQIKKLREELDMVKRWIASQDTFDKTDSKTSATLRK